MEDTIYSAILLWILGGGAVSMLIVTCRVRSQKWFFRRGVLQAVLWSVPHWFLSYIGIMELFVAMKGQGSMGDWVYAFFFVVPLLALVLRLLYWVEKTTAR